MQINSIRIIQDCLNLQSQIKAITALDNIISDDVDENCEIEEGQKYGSILSELMSPSKPYIFHPYLYETFQCFARHKKEIRINLYNIDKHVLDKQLKELLFSSLVWANADYLGHRSIKGWIYDDTNQENLIRPKIFGVFQHVEHLYMNVLSDFKQYPFSLARFLRIIRITDISKITLDMGQNLARDISRNWFSLRGFEVEAIGNGDLVICRSQPTTDDSKKAQQGIYSYTHSCTHGISNILYIKYAYLKP